MRRCWPVVAVLAALSGCGDNLDAIEPEPYDFDLPPHFPEPVVPAGNPMTEEKVQVGRHLFYDERVSSDQSRACASCHEPERAFSGTAVVSTEHGGVASRNVPSLANAAYMSTLTWASPDIYDLEQLAISGDVLARLRGDPIYESLRSTGDVRDALASFVRTIISGGSAFDAYAYDRDTTALSEAAQRGFEMFWSDRLSCFECHDGFNLSRATKFAGLQGVETAFHNTGLYNVDGAGAYPAADPGLFAHTGLPEDVGAFRTPSLRNIALTAPYYHDGSAVDLDAVLDDYAAGGRVIEAGPAAGDGRASPKKSEHIHGFALAESERADLKAFLESLTDASLSSAERLSNPWIQ